MAVTVTIHHKTSATLMPIGFDKKGAMWHAADITALIAKEIRNNSHFQRRVKNIMDDFKDVTVACDSVTKIFNHAIDSMAASQTRLSDIAKKTSSSVRSSATDLGDGLKRIEKAANFDKMAVYVGLLERMASAMSTLAELEKTGKLERIANAVK